jgi:hypothetical protein
MPLLLIICLKISETSWEYAERIEDSFAPLSIIELRPAGTRRGKKGGCYDYVHGVVPTRKHAQRRDKKKRCPNATEIRRCARPHSLLSIYLWPAASRALFLHLLQIFSFCHGINPTGLVR